MNNKFRHALPKSVTAAVRARGAISSAFNNIGKLFKSQPPLPFGNRVRVVLDQYFHVVFINRFSRELFAPVLAYSTVDLLRAVQDSLVSEDARQANSSLRVGEFLADIVTKVRRRTFIYISTVVQRISVLDIQDTKLVVVFF